MTDRTLPGQTRRYSNQFEFQHQWLRGRGLNVGCDTDPSGLKARGCVNVDVWDYNPHTCQKIPADVVADARVLPFKRDEFDTVILGDILEHFESDKDVITAMFEAWRVCVAGGRIVVTCPEDTREQEGKDLPPEMTRHIVPGVVTYHWRPVTLGMMRGWGDMLCPNAREEHAAWIAYPFCPEGGWGVVWEVAK